MQDLTTLWQALLLGVVEGLTEFLPVSSTGHLILLIDLLQFAGPPGKVFEIVIQLGAILAICWLYRAKLWQTLIGLPNDRPAQRFASNIVLSFLPAAILGVLFHSQIKAVLFSVEVVSIMLVVGGIIILLVERMPRQPKVTQIEAMSPWLAIKIGFCQALAMIPGTSRSGATIIGGLLLGLDRKTATEYSFFLAIPTMFGATVYDLYKNWHSLSAEGWEIIALGFLAAFFSALLVVRSLITFISRHGFIPFAWYRIALGGAMLLLVV
jgi:undecaprenyl-diphosphatase